MAKRGMVLVPTLTTFNDLAERFAAHFVPALVDQAKRQQEEARSTVMAAREAGVIMAMGFDSGPPGADALELVRMVDAGLTRHEAISAATIGSACALGLDDVGTIETGCAADLVVLDANPLLDLAALTRPDQVWMVVKAGRIAHR
jgi:imidazolonepropionase-like amidohydrolase